jgi:1-deoxy-D-xylulose-5-phosphate synthase
MLDWAEEQQDPPPVVIRLDNGEQFDRETTKITLNRSEIVQSGSGIAIISLGSMIGLAQEVASKLDNPTIINARFATALDTRLLDSLVENHTRVITLENNLRDGGLGQKIAEHFADTNVRVHVYGADKEFTDYVPLAKSYAKYRLTPEQIITDIGGQQ